MNDKKVPIAVIAFGCLAGKEKANCGCVFVQLRIGKRNAPQSHVAVEKSGKLCRQKKQTCNGDKMGGRAVRINTVMFVLSSFFLVLGGLTLKPMLSQESLFPMK